MEFIKMSLSSERQQQVKSKKSEQSKSPSPSTDRAEVIGRHKRSILRSKKNLSKGSRLVRDDSFLVRRGGVGGRPLLRISSPSKENNKPVSKQSGGLKVDKMRAPNSRRFLRLKQTVKTRRRKDKRSQISLQNS